MSVEVVCGECGHTTFVTLQEPIRGRSWTGGASLRPSRPASLPPSSPPDAAHPRPHGTYSSRAPTPSAWPGGSLPPGSLT
ncbi:MAG TPA: hypothetical protein VLC09_04200, partial [Polyangiaceae bacterium]|nr:hypothetical protein [Polyangiaceae bacterium]